MGDLIFARPQDVGRAALERIRCSAPLASAVALCFCDLLGAWPASMPDYRGLKSPGGSGIEEIPRIIGEVRAAFRGIPVIDYVTEPATISVRDMVVISEALQRRPVCIDSGGVCELAGARLYWLSFPLSLGHGVSLTAGEKVD